MTIGWTHNPDLLSLSRQLSRLLSASPHLVNIPTDEDHTTLLHMAAGSSLPAIPLQLLLHGAEVDRQNGDGLTPLHVAAMLGNTGTLKQLLHHGADPLIMDNDDMTPLNHAMTQGMKLHRWKSLSAHL